MSEHAQLPQPMRLVVHGKATDQETKDECFRLWIELGRSWAAVERRTGIGDSTLRNWAIKENWEQRRADHAGAFLPGKKTETAINLRFAAHSASVRLAEIGLDSVERGIKPDPKEVDALVKMAAAGGYSSVGSRDPLGGLDALESIPTQPDFESMSVEQLRDYEHSIKRRKRFDPSAPVVNGSRAKTG